MKVVPEDFRNYQFDPPLTNEELEVIEHLLSLGDEWIMKIRTQIVLKPPTAILVGPSGALIVNVLTWRPGEVRRVAVVKNDSLLDPQPDNDFHDDKELQLQQLIDGAWINSGANPRRDLGRTRKEISDEHFIIPGGPKRTDEYLGAVLVLPNMAGMKEATMLVDLTMLTQRDPQTNKVKIFGANYANQGIDGIISFANRNQSKEDIGASVKKLYRALKGPPADGPAPIQITGGTRNIGDNPNGARRRRIRGSPGSGKSLGLAARAATLAIEGKRVLFMGFNITLTSYLRELARSRLNGSGTQGQEAYDRIHFTHFHRFLSNLVGVEFTGSYGSVEQMTISQIEEASKLYKTQTYYGMRGLEIYRPVPIYDAILIDEGQDFRQEWWDFLRDSVLQEGGEMAVVVDRAQDIYTAGGWTDNMQGFGPWTELKESFRVPLEILPLAREIATKFELTVADLLPEPRQVTEISFFEQAEISWINVATDADKELKTVAEVKRILEAIGVDGHGELTILFDSHESGFNIVNQIQQELKTGTIEHVFSTDKAEQRKLKLAFDFRSKRLKACTVHSFKGWESRCVVYVPSRKIDPKLLFIAITRVKGYSEKGSSHLSIINSDTDFYTYDQFTNTVSEHSPESY